jgi:hypothetical protein
MAGKMTPGRQNFKAVDRKGREDRQGSVKSFRLAYLATFAVKMFC